MSESKEMNFQVTDNGGGVRNPRWIEVETVKNAQCPLCAGLMAVIQGTPLYAVCFRCQKYFIAQ